MSLEAIAKANISTGSLCDDITPEAERHPGTAEQNFLDKGELKTGLEHKLPV